MSTVENQVGIEVLTNVLRRKDLYQGVAFESKWKEGFLDMNRFSLVHRSLTDQRVFIAVG